MSHEIKPDYEKTFEFPPRLDNWVPPDHPVRFIREFVDSLNLAQLGFKEHKEGLEGRPHYANTMLLAIWVYGYLEHIYSSRQLEKACQKELPLLWLSGLHYPDHNTLWKFFSDNQGAIGQVFSMSVKLAVKMGLVGLVLQAVDGTKIAADVNADRSLYLTKLKTLYGTLELAVGEAVARIKQQNKQESKEPVYRLPLRYREKQKLDWYIRTGLEQLKQEKKVALMLGVESEMKRLEEAGVNQMNLTDRDAREMIMSKKKTQFAYNAQAVVDEKSQIVVASKVSQEGSDNYLLTSMIEKAAENTGKVCEETLGDTGYFSGEELQKAQDKGYSVLVSVQKDKTVMSATATNIQTPESGVLNFKHTNFAYDEVNDEYLCPMGQRLRFEAKKKHRSGRYHVRLYRCQPEGCAYRGVCTRSDKGRTIERSPYVNVQEAHIRKLASHSNRLLLKQRKRIIEPLFGWIKRNHGFTRWTYRGLKSVGAQWAMICSVINLKKIFEKWKEGAFEWASD